MLFDFVDREGKATGNDFMAEDSETIACEENQDPELEWETDWESDWESDWEAEQIAEWTAALNADIEEYLRLQCEIDDDL